MKILNHVGQISDSGRKCIVAYKTLPGDAYNCLIIPTESLPDVYHDDLMNLVETNAAQSSFEMSEVLFRSTFRDGSNMLVSLHAKGYLHKVPTDKVVMTPNHQSSMVLSELNHQLAQIRGVSVQDLAVSKEPQSKDVQEVGQINEMPKPVEPTVTEALSDQDLAEKYRADAARLAREAEEMLKMAEQLAPTKVEITKQPVVETKSVASVEEPKSAETVKPTPKRTQSRPTRKSTAL